MAELHSTHPAPCAGAQPTAAPALSIRWEPELLARVVADELERRDAAGDREPLARYRAQTEPLYETQPGDREPLFHRLDLATAAALGLDRPLLDALARAGFPPGAIKTLVVAPATRPAQEGADVRPPARAGHAELRVRPSRFAAREELALFLRHELVHLADLLDPAFGYGGERATGPDAREQLVRDRYRALWCASVDVRTARAGLAPLEPPARRVATLAGFYGLLPADAEALCDWLAARPPHEVLVDVATTPESLALACPKLSSPKIRARRTRCPVCQMPAHPECRAADDLPDHVLAMVRADRAGWKPDDGLCDRCREVYLLREGAPCH